MSNDKAAVMPEGPQTPAEFWMSEDERFELPPPGDCEPALKVLGPLPFPRGSFPLMGLFATVYEHVATHAREQLKQIR